ncbi:S1C family serine protease [Oceanobacillus kapialis]|uniref:S1C family serine protease n=1 Tax=Oceanobacillus kapialis TaxID=481353 RepID=A0ABW5Q4P7_9BACI
MDRHKEDKEKPDIIDEDLYEEFDDEELYEIVQEERRKAWQRDKEEKDGKPKRPFPKWIFWVIALALAFNVFALIPQTFSIPAIDFLITSAKLSADEDIRTYKKAVVVVETENAKGTGFSIDSSGTILTNHHVIEGEEQVTVAFPDDGLFEAEVVKTNPSIDLAVLQVDGTNLPSLELADSPKISEDLPITFIGNPLRFNGIANEGTIAGYTQLNDWEREVVMIKAPVYRGNSGSPIINEQGKVIGVVFATLDHETEGKVGLFVPITYFEE